MTSKREQLTVAFDRFRRFWLRPALRFLRYLADRYRLDRAPNTAASLTFTTLLALVPLAAVVLSIFAAFPVFQTVSDEIQDYVFQQFVPAVGDAVQDHLQQFVDGAGRLTAVGTMFLVVTALLLMHTIDRAFNDIWGIRERRNPVALFMVYWAVLTLGPLLLGMSVVVSSYLFSLPYFADLDEGLGLQQRVLSVVPFAFGAVAFTLMYAVVPNRPVPWRHALAGGVVAAALFEMAKWGFGHYVAMVPTYELVYGALSTLPFLMVWLYVVWLIVLLGVEVSRCLTVFPREAAEGAVQDSLLTAFRCIGHLYEAQQRGEGVGLGDLLRREPNLGEPVVYEVMQRLTGERLVHRTAAGEWALARDLDQVTLLDLYLALADHPPRPPAGDGRPWDQRLAGVMQAGWRDLSARLETPLSRLYEAEAAAEPPARALTPRAR